MNTPCRLFGFITFVAAAALPMTVRCCPPSNQAESEPQEKKSQIVECRISFIATSSDHLRLELRITDAKLVKELIEVPVAQARADPNPARYTVLGTVLLKRKDGSEENFSLFLPWGRFKVKEKYFITDFSGLRKAFKKQIKDAADFLD